MENGDSSTSSKHYYQMSQITQATMIRAALEFCIF